MYGYLLTHNLLIISELNLCNRRSITENEYLLSFGWRYWNNLGHQEKDISRQTIEETFLDSSYTHVSYQFANETFSDVLLPFLSTQLNQLVDEIPGSAILSSDIARIHIFIPGFWDFSPSSAKFRGFRFPSNFSMLLFLSDVRYFWFLRYRGFPIFLPGSRNLNPLKYPTPIRSTYLVTLRGKLCGHFSVSLSCFLDNFSAGQWGYSWTGISKTH